MSQSVGVQSTSGSEPVSFGAKFQSSEQFDQIFRSGMALVEKAAAYLDGPGRAESKGLQPSVTVLYATESMRLTTRLLDLASWLLIRRALKAGEITTIEADKRRRKVRLQSFGRPSHTSGFADLPDGLRGLVHESFALYDRIVQLDRAMTVTAEGDPVETAPSNPVAQQVMLLERAFGKPALC